MLLIKDHFLEDLPNWVCECTKSGTTNDTKFSEYFYIAELLIVFLVSVVGFCNPALTFLNE